MDMATRIKMGRKALGISQAELAKRAGTDQGHISRLESGDKGAGTETLAGIARELNISFSQLVGVDWQEADGNYDPQHPARKILRDSKAPVGLRDLAADLKLVDALRIREEEWATLKSLKPPREVGKDGYVQLLITIRAVISASR